MSTFDRLTDWLETVSRDLNAFLFGAGRGVHRELIIHDKERDGVLYCPQASFDEVIPLDTCKACAYHEKPSLRNGFMSMCLFSKEKREEEERLSPFARPRSLSANPDFPGRATPRLGTGLLNRPRAARTATPSRPRFSLLDRKIQPEQDIERRLREIIRMAENIEAEARALLRELEDIQGRFG